MTAFMPMALNARKFNRAPFVLQELRGAEYVYVPDNTLAKPTLAPRYTCPFQVIARNWKNSTFKLQIRGREDKVSLSRLKATADVGS